MEQGQHPSAAQNAIEERAIASSLDYKGFTALGTFALLDQKLPGNHPAITALIDQATAWNDTRSDFSVGATTDFSLPAAKDPGVGTDGAGPAPDTAPTTSIRTAARVFMESVTSTSTRRKKRLARVRLLTWNIFHGDLPDSPALTEQQNAWRLTPEDRLLLALSVGGRRQYNLMAFQEVQKTYIAGLQAAAATRDHRLLRAVDNTNRRCGTNYGVIVFDHEYDPSSSNTVAQSSDGYLLFYDRNRLTRVGAADLFQAPNFQHGLSYSRPPLEQVFVTIPRPGTQEVPTNFYFFCWHAEANSNVSDDIRQWWNLGHQQGGNWIMAGDLNLNLARLVTATSGVPRTPNLSPAQEFHNDDPNSLDFVISNGLVNQSYFPEGALFMSDAHRLVAASVIWEQNP